MSEYVSPFVICPYYHRESPNSVMCDGVGIAEYTCLKFRTKLDKSLYFKCYCNTHKYNECTLAVSLRGKGDGEYI